MSLTTCADVCVCVGFGHGERLNSLNLLNFHLRVDVAEGCSQKTRCHFWH